MVKVFELLGLSSVVPCVLFLAFFGRLPIPICVEYERHTPISKLSKLSQLSGSSLHHSSWKRSLSALTRLVPWKTKDNSRSCILSYLRYLFHERHRVAMICWLSLYTISVVILVCQIWLLVSSKHRVALTLLASLPYLFTYLSHTSRSHIIDSNSKGQNEYASDFKLFHPSMRCEQCKIPRLARSRHCSLCGVCVARADHHCIWVDNCIGEGNHKYFLGLLLSMTAALLYAVFLVGATFTPGTEQSLPLTPWNQRFKVVRSTEDTGWYMLVFRHKDLWLGYLGSTIPREMIAITFVGSTALFVFPLAAALLAYHVYLICAGMTTYEHFKWRQWGAVISKGLAYTAPIIRSDEGPTYTSKRTVWGKQASQFLVLTNDGKVPRRLPPEVLAHVGETVIWTRVESLSDLENVYNLGIVRNWKMLLES